MKTIASLNIPDCRFEKMWAVLMNWNVPSGDYWGFWYGYAALSAECNISIKGLTKIMSAMKEKRIVSYCTLMREHEVVGKGYLVCEQYRSKEWYEIKELIK